MRALTANRLFFAYLAAAVTAGAGYIFWPLPPWHPALREITHASPVLAAWLRWIYYGLLFSTPFLAVYWLLSVIEVYVVRKERVARAGKLPPYPEPKDRKDLYLVLGETHYEREFKAHPNPQWLIMPEAGMYTGLMIFGATGASKTSAAMLPYADQIFGFHRRIGGLVLEVKGDFCDHIRQILQKHGRGEDYCEISIGGKWRYDPLAKSIPAYALAFSIASLLEQIRGKSREPYWRQASENVIKFLIMLHRSLYGHCTLLDIYRTMSDPDLLKKRIEEGRQRFWNVIRFLDVKAEDYMSPSCPDLLKKGFAAHRDGVNVDYMRAPFSDELLEWLLASEIENQVVTIERKHKDLDFEAVAHWFDGEWRFLKQETKSSVGTTVSGFFSLFDSDQALKYTFCPEKGADNVLPEFEELIESGKVVGVNFDVVESPGLARLMATLIKQAYQRGVAGRVRRHKRQTTPLLPSVFLCDEYQTFATVGANDPNGDEKFFAVSRQNHCVAVVAFQSVPSAEATLGDPVATKALMQTFRSKLFLTISDPTTAKYAVDLFGREERQIDNLSYGESGSNTKVSPLGAKATADQASLSTTVTYSRQMRDIFETNVLTSLKNAQAIAYIYDGRNPLPPQAVCLKPYYLPVQMTWYEANEKGML